MYCLKISRSFSRMAAFFSVSSPFNVSNGLGKPFSEMLSAYLGLPHPCKDKTPCREGCTRIYAWRPSPECRSYLGLLWDQKLWFHQAKRRSRLMWISSCLSKISGKIFLEVSHLPWCCPLKIRYGHLILHWLHSTLHGPLCQYDWLSPIRFCRHFLDSEDVSALPAQVHLQGRAR